MQQIKSTNHPTLQKTSFGWIVAGHLNESVAKQTVCNLTINTLDNQLQKFWNIEEIAQGQPFTQEENKVEQHFIDTHQRTEEGRFVVRLPFKENTLELGQRTEEGRFVVRLPFKENTLELGESKGIANESKTLYLTERNLQKDQEVKQRYINFMNEYQ
ncbi:hypothetical protein QE152_g25819 [Popillia japonica]|uniref:Uncharacterized protein n=1 Tax=Popillia japonica TaxID=7064 RepID=A0AAW1K097_POPJA